MLRTNEESLVQISITGSVHHPTKDAYIITRSGKPTQYPNSGGITYNVTVGDCAFGLMGNHIEPDVSTKNSDADENAAYKMLACTGNEATVITGDAKGSKGYVLGTNDHIEHVIIHFDSETKEKLAIGDKVQVKSVGRGLKLIDYDNISVKKIAPRLLHCMGIEECDGILKIPVTCMIPGCLIGSSGIMSGDRELIEEYGINKLKFGDFVYISDTDTLYGRDFLRGAATIAVIIHSDCMSMGHGAGICSLMTSVTGSILPEISASANIKYCMK